MKSIPRIFHFVFGLRPQTEPFHLMHYLCIASCIEVNKPDKIMFHYHHLPWGPWWELIAPRLELHKIEPDEFVSNFRYADKKIAKLRYAHLSDIARLKIIIRYGGVYADIDTLFVNSLPESFYSERFIMGNERVDWTAQAARDAGGSLCNAWMMGEPGAAFAGLWLKETYAGFDGSWSGHSTFLPYRLSRLHPDLIRVEPERSFFAYDWSPDGLRGIFRHPPADVEGVYSIHLWNHMWWDRNRVDASYFHAGRLTPEYVRFSESAYATLARRFLPCAESHERPAYEFQRAYAFLEDLRIIIKKYGYTRTFKAAFNKLFPER
jgi:hypothetical protein